MDKNQIGAAYGNQMIMLLLGGFILSKSMERSGAHRRLALYMINLVGASSQARIVLGFMIASAALSMWISNTATTLILLPVALAVVESAKDAKLAPPLILGIAWSASIGGMGTPLGTPPNLVFMQVYEEQIGKSIGFTEWMSLALPVVLIMVPCAAFVLTRGLNAQQALTLPEVGKWNVDEKRVVFVFALTALAWMTRKEPFGGWSTWFGFPNANDAAVALAAVIAMFIIPNGKGDKLLDWKTASDIPWGILLLFGGGICLAKAFSTSGLSELVGQNLAMLTTMPVLIMIGLLCLSVTFLTETTSNTASTILLMPILAAVAVNADINPLLLMFPAVLSASCAFMLPVATAPNSIAYSSGFFSTRYMARKGLVLNVIGVVVIASYSYLVNT